MNIKKEIENLKKDIKKYEKKFIEAFKYKTKKNFKNSYTSFYSLEDKKFSYIQAKLEYLYEQLFEKEKNNEI